MPLTKKTEEQKKVDAYVGLLVAEAEFLRVNGWTSLSPITPGGDVRWRPPYYGAGSFSQSVAVEKQKRREKA